MLIISWSVCPRKVFQSREIFVGKAIKLPKSGASERCLTRVVSCFTQKHLARLKDLYGKNTLAYYKKM